MRDPISCLTSPYVSEKDLFLLIKKHKEPHAWIEEKIQNRELICIGEGHYLVKSKIPSAYSTPRGLIANSLYKPSYVSLEWAMSFYGLIPERVVVTTSVTLEKSTHFELDIGGFSYSQLSFDRYNIGVDYYEYSNSISGYFIANREKCLIDFIFLVWKNFICLEEFLESMRIELEDIQNLNKKEFERIATQYKSRSVDKFVEAL